MKNYSPENTAIRFVQNSHEKKWSQIYGDLDIRESQFISKDMLIQGKTGEVLNDQKNYRISELDISTDGNNATAIVLFENGLHIVDLVKENKKAMLFFERWKVLPNGDILKHNFEFQVPSGAEVSLGGITLDKILISDQDEFYTWYVIPQIFSGEYEVKVKLDPMEEYVDYINSDDYHFTLENMNLGGESHKLLIKDASILFKEIYGAVFANKTFSEIQHLYTGKKTNTVPVMEELKFEYNNLLTNHPISSPNISGKIDFYDAVATSKCSIVDGKPNLVVYVECEGAYEESLNGVVNYRTVNTMSAFHYEYSDNAWSLVLQEFW